MSIEPDPLVDDERIIKAMANPLRWRLLLALDDGVASPIQLSRRLAEPLGRVSHHIRVLHALEAVELVATEPRRGAVEHFYRAVVRPVFDDDVWAQLPRGTRRALFGEHLARIGGDVSRAAESGGFDHPRAHVSYIQLDLDDEGMDAVADVLIEAVERVTAIRAGAKKRLADGPARLQTELAILHFGQP